MALYPDGSIGQLQNRLDELERRLSTLRTMLFAALALALISILIAAFALARPAPSGQAGGATTSAPAAATSTPAATPEMIKAGAPADAGAAGSGTIVLGTPGKGMPVLDIYEDFQCPACAGVEPTFGPQVDALLADGRVEVRYHMMSFLDEMLRNDSSVRAAAGGFCADDQGRFKAWHDTLFSARYHPKTEGDGWTDAQLKAMANASGLDVGAWSTCLKQPATSTKVADANKLALAGGVNATPTFTLNGTKLDLQRVIALGGLVAVVDANR